MDTLIRSSERASDFASRLTHSVNTYDLDRCAQRLLAKHMHARFNGFYGLLRMDGGNCRYHDGF